MRTLALGIRKNRAPVCSSANRSAIRRDVRRSRSQWASAGASCRARADCSLKGAASLRVVVRCVRHVTRALRSAPPWTTTPVQPTTTVQRRGRVDVVEPRGLQYEGP
ncbi:hypothetical protein MTO96_019411 [Rhipicephalus appendiculatus]